MIQVEVDLNNQKWVVIFRKPRNLQGLCNWERREIKINPALRGAELFEVILHEMLHAEMPDASEEAVERMSVEMTLAMEALGFLPQHKWPPDPSKN